jgi:Fe-S-cluster-containing hydrogenase component 2
MKAVLGTKRAFIDPEHCRKCDPCPLTVSCPKKSMQQEEKEIPYVDNGCNGCGTCLKECPYKAVFLV